MSRFEDMLRDALRREDPGEDFTRRVLAAARRERPSWRERLAGAFRLPALRWATAALAILLTVGGVEYRHEQRVRAEGEAAKEQLMLAMRIAGTKLHLAQTKVMEINRR